MHCIKAGTMAVFLSSWKVDILEISGFHWAVMNAVLWQSAVKVLGKETTKETLCNARQWTPQLTKKGINLSLKLKVFFLYLQPGRGIQWEEKGGNHHPWQLSRLPDMFHSSRSQQPDVPLITWADFTTQVFQMEHSSISFV